VTIPNLCPAAIRRLLWPPNSFMVTPGDYNSGCGGVAAVDLRIAERGALELCRTLRETRRLRGAYRIWCSNVGATRWMA